MKGLKEMSSCISESSVTKHWAVLDKLQSPSSIGDSIKADFTAGEVVESPLLQSSQH